MTGDLKKGRHRAVILPVPLYQNLVRAKALAQEFDIPFATILKLRYAHMPDLWAYLDRSTPARPTARPVPAALPLPVSPNAGLTDQLDEIQRTLSTIVKGQEHVLRNVTQMLTATPPKTGS